jgi:plastocyanin
LSGALRIAPASLVLLALLGRTGAPAAARETATTPAPKAPAATPKPAMPKAAATSRLDGRLALLERGKPSRDRSVDLGRAVVWFEPDRKPRSAVPVVAEMLTVRKQFSPQLLVVPVGSTVRFPNQDPILHNAFSVSAGNRFDLGLVGAGTGKTATFKAAGIVQVFCNVHHGMFAHVVVVATPHYARPDAAGAFALEGLPAGAGTLHYWHERGAPASRRVTLPHREPVALELAASLPRVPPHRNKAGKSYAAGAYE